MLALSLPARLTTIDAGELTNVPRSVPFSVVFPPQENCPVIYTTKAHAGLRLFLTETEEPSVGMIARYGLPDPSQIAALNRIVGERELFFLGDCDPFDLLTFAWLRAHRTIRYLGISDAVRSAVGLQWKDSMLIHQSAEEQDAMALVADVLPSYAELVGPRCSEVLANKQKIELEALVSFCTRPHSELIELLKRFPG